MQCSTQNHLPVQESSTFLMPIPTPKVCSVDLSFREYIKKKKKKHSLPINAYICEKAAKVCAEI